MLRRQFNSIWITLPGGVLALAPQWAQALSLDDLSNAETAKGLKMALEKGAIGAIGLLGRPDGFMGNDRVRIALPSYLEEASKLLRALGQGARIDELVLAMNRAAEAAVPLSKDLLVGAVRSMTVTDAKNILTGPDTAATDFFAGKTRTPLQAKFLPVVSRVVAKMGLAEKYNQVVGKAADLGLMKREDASIQQYVTGRSLDALYLMIGDEERKIRKDPIGTGSALLGKVFGALR